MENLAQLTLGIYPCVSDVYDDSRLVLQFINPTWVI